MEFFNLPVKSKVDKNIPKEIIYKNAEADEKFKRIFIENVEKIRYEYALTYGNSNIEKYVKDDERYEEIHFIRVVLREKGKENTISKLLHQLIPKGTILILEYGDEILISVARKKIGSERVTLEEIYNSSWISKKSDKLKELDYTKLNPTNMKILYDNLIQKIRVINLSRDLEVGKSVESDSVDILENLNREIEELKVMRKKETQINRVAQIQSELLKKIKERDSLMGK